LNVFPKLHGVEIESPLQQLRGGTFKRWLNAYMQLAQMDYCCYHGSGFIRKASLALCGSLSLSLSLSLSHTHTPLCFLSQNDTAGPSMLDFPASRMVRNKFMFVINYPIPDVLVKQQNQKRYP
jgi:hypothetical protein